MRFDWTRLLTVFAPKPDAFAPDNSSIAPPRQTALLVTADELHRIMPHANGRVESYVDPLNDAMSRFGIDNPDRIAAFLANVAHESGELKYVEELASGDAYEGRADLGNTEPGDGRKFKGRGLMQVTGRSNTRACSLALFNDERLLDNPEILEQPEYAAASAAWFWYTRSLSILADKGQFKAVVRKINGGTTGMQSRLEYWNRAKEVLG